VIGITLVSNWYEPLSNNKLDKSASERALDFMLGWWVHNFIFKCCNLYEYKTFWIFICIV